MKKAIINPSELCGEVKIPPSKSLQHRAIIAAAFSSGESYINNVEFSKDIEATCRILNNLGVTIDKKDHGVKVKSKGNFKVINKTLNCGESGSTLRFTIPMGCINGEEVIFEGEGKLKERPLEPYYSIFRQQGIFYENHQGNLPLRIHGKLKPDVFNIPGDISSQFITGLLYTLPVLKGDSVINIEGNLQSKSYVDLTLQMLKKFSINIENKNYEKFYISGNQKYKNCNYRVEGDFSQAAFWIGAGVINGNIKIKDLNLSTMQGDKSIIDIVKKMGGDISIEKETISVKKSNLKGIEIDASQIPDLVPILAVIASLSQGTTRIVKAGRLRIKESDRLKAITEGINKLGGEVYEGEDYLIIEGKSMLEGGEVDSFNDHRIAMALAIASLKCKFPVIINNSEAVNKSYPQFYEHFKKLGGKVYVSNK